MPQIQDTPPPPSGPEASVRASVAVELEWALCSGGNQEFLEASALLTRVYGDHPDLRDRVRAQWAGEEAVSCFGFFELLVLAHRGGLLFSTDADALLVRLDDLCRAEEEGPDRLPLRSETAQDAEAIRRRLAVLRTSDARRTAYVSLVTDVWRAVRDGWLLSGRPAVEAAVAARREDLARGGDWRRAGHLPFDHDQLLEQIVAALGPDGEVVIVPATFTHKGLYLDLPGVVVIGVRADPSGAEARARTEALARRLKAVSDPTRLAVLDTLRREPRTVTELSTAFGLAQPTVSNHVKVLREAGLLVDERHGTRRTLRVDSAAVAALLTGLQNVLAGSEP
jgi:DNA-binding transcriptional ArsR family regulator